MTLGEYIGGSSGTTKGLYHLNGNSNDSSGNGNNGTDTNMTYGTGILGNCAIFSGSSSKIDAAIGTITGNFTFSLWVKRNGTCVANGGIFDVGTYNTTGFGLWTFDGTGGFTDGALSWRINDDYNNYTSVGYVLPNLTWTMITVVYNGTNVAFYVNGALRGTPHAHTTNPAAATTLVIGQRKDSAISDFTGNIDELIIENIARDAAKIKKHYTYSKGRFGII